MAGFVPTATEVPAAHAGGGVARGREHAVEVLVVGGGLCGLAAARTLAGRRVLVVERADAPGGKARSRHRAGYTFDLTGHFLHLRTDEVRRFVFAHLPSSQWMEVERRASIHVGGTFVPYPFQTHLHALGPAAACRCLSDFVEARIADARAAGPPATFAEFIERRFGRTMAEVFFVPYNEKLWGMDLDTLTATWMGRFLPDPEPSQVVAGALGIEAGLAGYNATFLYPRAGGIGRLPDALAAALDEGVLQRGVALSSVDAGRRRAVLSDGRVIRYERMISTIPLPELSARIDDAPETVRQAAGRLRAVDWRYLDVALRRPPGRAEHWIYVPDRNLPFFRVGAYSNVCPAMAPAGGGALYVELADRRGPLDLSRVYAGLAALGVIDGPKDVAFACERRIAGAYVVFDAHWKAAVETIRGWCRARGIDTRGRYGRWTYDSMEGSLLDGIRAARELEGQG